MNQQQVTCKCGAFALLQTQCSRIGWWLKGFFLNKLEHLEHRFAPGILQLPAGRLFSDRIHVFDVTVQVGGNNAITNRAQCYLCPFLFLVQCFLGLLECSDVANGSLNADYFTAFIIFIVGVFGNPYFRAIAVLQPRLKMLQPAVIHIK